MRQLFIYLFFFLSSLQSTAQTRIFLSAGGSFNTDYEPKTFFSPGIGNAVWKTDGSYVTEGLKYWTVDVDIEKKISKFFVVSGLHLFQSGYSNYRATNFSALQSTHLGIPLLIRINFLNYCYLDIGTIGVVNLDATLEETALQGSALQVHDKRNIASFLSPITMGIHLQYSIVVNRYFIAAYFTRMDVSVDESLKKNWNLGGRYQGNSLFLNDMGSEYRCFLFGLKIGMRIK